MPGSCAACNKAVLVTQKRLKCSNVICSLLYHSECVNCEDSSLTNRATWVCPQCVARKPKRDNTNTPIRSQGHKQQSPENASVSSHLLSTGIPVCDIVEELRILRQEMSEQFANQRACLDKFDAKLSDVQREVKDLGGKFNSLKKDVDELTKSVQFLSDTHDEQVGLNDDVKKSLSNLNSENQNLRSQIFVLEGKMDQLEQQARDCNVELQCVPENKNENILTIVQQMASIVTCDLSDQNILSYHRVPKVDSKSQRTRSIVVKLASPRIRDDLLASVKRFNKKNPQNKLNTSHLGFAGQISPVYVVEHLSLKNKKLHAATRLAAKEKKYEFVWIRNGRVFVRKNNESPAQWIKNVDVLKNLV